MQWAASVHTHTHTEPPSTLPPHPKWQKISRINLAAKPLSLEHANCHSFPITKKWGVAQFAGVHFEQREDGKLTARLQIYGRVICPDADVLVAAFTFRSRKQGSHLKTTDVVVFSWQGCLNLQFNNFSSQISVMRKDSHLHWHDTSVIFQHFDISGEAGKRAQLLTLSLLWLLHIKTRDAPAPAPCTQQKEEEIRGIIRHLPPRQGQTQNFTEDPPLISSAFSNQHCSEDELTNWIIRVGVFLLYQTKKGTAKALVISAVFLLSGRCHLSTQARFFLGNLTCLPSFSESVSFSFQFFSFPSFCFGMGERGGVDKKYLSPTAAFWYSAKSSSIRVK